MNLLTQEYKDYWSPLSKLIVRSIITYFLLYMLLMLLSPLFEVPYRWIGKTVFEIDYTYEVNGNGSGDHTYAYLTLFITVILSVVIVVLWSALDSARKSYNVIWYWFLVFLRVVLALTMIIYGFVKIFKLQFPSATLAHLLDPLGDFTPMGLAWTYLGYSKEFNVFIGLLEVLGGILLIPRRTLTLGSFIIIGIMTQVAVMNFCYDIPVKIFSVHLVLMALVLFVTDHRFAKVFIANKPVTTYHFYHPIKNKKYHRVIYWMKSMAIVVLVAFISFNFYTTERNRGSNRTKPVLYGIWEATYFIKNGDTLPPLITDDFRWRYLIVEQEDEATIKTMDDIKHYYKFSADSSSRKISIHKKESKIEGQNFNYKNDSSNNLKLNGIIDSDTLQIIFSSIDEKKFNLNARGFHWVNESPFIEK